MLALATAAKLIAEIALLSLAGQWLLGLLAGEGRDRNLFYQLLKTLGSPFVRFSRWVAPRLILDRHLPLVAFLLVLMLWTGATLVKIQSCLKVGLAVCK